MLVKVEAEQFAFLRNTKCASQIDQVHQSQRHSKGRDSDNRAADELSF